MMCFGLMSCSCLLSGLVCYFFFFKQKTAYEMRISDWSSDVCSSDLWHPVGDVLRVANLAHHVFVEAAGCHVSPLAEIDFGRVGASTRAAPVLGTPSFGRNPAKEQAPILRRTLNRPPLPQPQRSE